MDYQLIAIDMDGTLVNTSKEISPEDIDAVNHALDLGKDVVISTGRCIGEVIPYLSLFPKMKYVLCASGASIYDVEKKELFAQTFLPENISDEMISFARVRDIEPNIHMNGYGIVNRAFAYNTATHMMPHYQGTFVKSSHLVEDAYKHYDELRAKGLLPEKLCFYHRTMEDLRETMAAFKEYNATIIHSEAAAIEVTPIGIDKATGLINLCKKIDLPLKKTIAIGDAANDLPVFKIAGLAISMDNAPDDIKAETQATVSDNDHFGVKEAIEKYLLQSNV